MFHCDALSYNLVCVLFVKTAAKTHTKVAFSFYAFIINNEVVLYLKQRGCTAGGVYVLYIYTHASGELL